MIDDTVDLLGLDVARVDEPALLDHIFTSLDLHEGGWLLTANLDFLRRYARDTNARALYDAADVVVADGMPLVWASALQGDRLPARVAGSTLVWSLAREAARRGRSLYLLGGDPEASEPAARTLTEYAPGLRIAGRSSPFIASPPSSDDIASIRSELADANADIVLVAFGSPKQEELIDALRSEFPGVWWVGVGISFSFVSGHVARAPMWMQKSGLEWAHRLVQEPRRLAKRYLVDDIPFAFRLFASAAWRRVRK